MARVSSRSLLAKPEGRLCPLERRGRVITRLWMVAGFYCMLSRRGRLLCERVRGWVKGIDVGSPGAPIRIDRVARRALLRAPSLCVLCE